MDRRADILQRILKRMIELEPGDAIGSVKIYLDELPELRRAPDERAVYLQDAARRAIESTAYMSELESALIRRRDMGDRRDWDGSEKAEEEVERVRAKCPWPRTF